MAVQNSQQKFPGGVWPTMITPFTEHNKIDYPALEQMVNWYVEHQVDGLFAVCQSSEMFVLSLQERVDLARAVVEFVDGRVPVVASGHISEFFDDQVQEITAISNTGIQAFILVSNRLATPSHGDDVWEKNLLKLLERIPPIPLGFYECPTPYKRLISPELLKRAVELGRFYFLKETSCEVDTVRDKMRAINNTQLKLYNANAQTLLETLEMGAVGYSSVMANFHPELYAYALKLYEIQSDFVRELFDFLSIAALIEYLHYPVCAKYYLQLEGLDISLFTRVVDSKSFSHTLKLQVEQLWRLTQVYKQKCQQILS